MTREEQIAAMADAMNTADPNGVAGYEALAAAALDVLPPRLVKAAATKLIAAVIDEYNANTRNVARLGTSNAAYTALIAALTAPSPQPSADDVALVDALEGEVIGNCERGYANGPAYERARAAVLARMAVRDDEATVGRVVEAMLPHTQGYGEGMSSYRDMARAAIKAMPNYRPSK